MMALYMNYLTNRLPELMDLLDEIEGKVVIWAHFQRDVHRIIEAYQ